MNCQICGKKLDLFDPSNVDVTIADGKGEPVMNRHFVVCENCACKVLALFATSDPMCKKCDKEHQMKKIFIDIENTIIDSLFSRNWMYENIERIKKFLKANEKDTLTVNIFTWGWKTTNEIEPELVTMLFDKLEVPASNRGNVVIKENSVDLAIKEGWLKPEDKEEAICPGMMSEYGLSKVMMFLKMSEKFIPGTTSILIDDLVDEYSYETIGSNVKVILHNPKAV